MEENFEFQDNANDELESVSRFEEMLRNKSFRYFDLSELEEIADHYLASGDTEKAEKTVETGLTLHPDSSLMFSKLAIIHFEKGKFKDSLSAVSKAEHLDPLNEEILLLKAQIYSQIDDRLMSIQYLNKALEVCSIEDKAEILMEIAQEYQALGKHEKTIDILQHVILEYPEQKTAIYELAICYDLAGEYEKSITYYKQYLDEDPYSFISWYNLGNCLCRAQDYDNAISAFDFALAINDKLSSAYFNKATAYTHMGEYHKAIEAFSETMKLEGEQAITHNFIGESYEKLNMYPEALEHYYKATDLDEKLSDPWMGIGIVKDLQGYLKEGLPFIEKAVKLEDSNYSHWTLLGNAYEKNDNRIDAERCYKKALELNPECADAYVDFSNLLYGQNLIEDAINIILEGLKKCNEDIDILEYRLAIYLFEDGQKQEALSHLEDALQLNFDGIKHLLEFYPEITRQSDVMQLIQYYSK